MSLLKFLKKYDNNQRHLLELFRRNAQKIDFIASESCHLDFPAIRPLLFLGAMFSLSSRFVFFFLCVLALHSWSFAAEGIVKGKTGIESIDSLPTYEWDIPTSHNSLPLTFLCGLFPGGGQFYTGHYIRGGFIAGIELALAYEVFYNKRIQKDRRFEMAQEFQDSVAFYTQKMLTGRDSMVVYQSRRNDFANHIRKISDVKIEQEDLRKSEMTWMIGLHIYSLFDAYGIWVNNKGHSVEQRPVTGALLRSLVPGWGQMYNDEYGKAGLLYMGLLGATVSIASRQNVVDYYLQRRRDVLAEDPKSTDIDDLTEQITYFRKNRNQYIWGISLIYLYSIGDAVVDAMLSDFDSPAHLAFGPDFRGGLQATLRVDF